MADASHAEGASDQSGRGLELDEAVSRLFESDDVLQQVEALHEVAAVRERAPELTPQLRELLSDESAPNKLRHAVAIELEGRGDIEGLIESLRISDHLALRGVLSALGRSGPEEALEEIEQSELPEQASRAARWARRLLAYRHRRDSEALLDVGELLSRQVEPDEPEELSVERATLEEARRVLREAEPSLPAVATSTEGAVAFTCGGQRHVALPAGDPREIATTAEEAPQVAALVAAEFPPEQTFGARYFVLTQPLDDGVGVSLTTMAGLVRAVGTAETSTGELQGTLISTRSPGAVIFSIEFTANDDGFFIGRFRFGGRVPSNHVEESATEPWE